MATGSRGGARPPRNIFRDVLAAWEARPKQRRPEPCPEAEGSTESGAPAGAESAASPQTPADRGIPDRLGPYTLLWEIGHGSTGVVYEAVHDSLQVSRAVKVLRAGRSASKEVRARFARGATAVARLGYHPNIVQVHDLGTDRGFPYMAMDLIPGVPLTWFLRVGGFTWLEAVALLEQTARALQFCHVQGVIHRDVKPGNLLVRDEVIDGVRRMGRPFLTDFGLARDREADPALITTGHTALGTKNYMPPEQEQGRSHDADARSDIYSLGCVLLRMIKCLDPDSVPDLLRRKKERDSARGELEAEELLPLSDEADAPRKGGPVRRLPPDLARLCLRCIANSPSRRYQHTWALAEDFARVYRGEPLALRPAGIMRRVLRRLREGWGGSDGARGPTSPAPRGHRPAP